MTQESSLEESSIGQIVKRLNQIFGRAVKRKGKMARRCAVVVGMLGMAALGTAGLTGWPMAVGHGERETPAQDPIARVLPTAVVERQPELHVRAFPGTVRAARRVDLAFSVPGVLEVLNAQEGRNLRQGEVIAVLDQRDYQNALDAAKARFVKAERNLGRIRALWEKRVTPTAKYEDAKADHDIALADLRIQEKALEDTVLLAPFDGLIVRRRVETHEHVKARETIVAFQDLSSIEVVIQVPERVIAYGGPDGLGPLKVRFDADRSRWFDAAVKEYSAEADPITRTYDVIVALAPPKDLTIFAGMTATVQAHIDDRQSHPRATQGLTRIPVEALWRGPDSGSYVWVIAPEGGPPEKREVEALALSDGCVQIRAGLEPGEHVAIAGLHSLRETLWVRPMKMGLRGLDG